MQTNQISPETEIALIRILKKYYPHAHFEIISKIEKTWVDIDFKGYFTESALIERPYPSPYDQWYRLDECDFSISFAPQKNFLFMVGNWRGAILTLHYDNNDYVWSDEGEVIPRPYPDGDKFEVIAQEMHPILIKNYET